MDWQEACSKSDLGKAIRRNKWHTYIRNSDGESFYINVINNTSIPVPSENIRGYLDWEPYND